MNRLERFDIRSFSDRLTILKEESTQTVYECPVCGGHRLTVNKQSGAYKCWSGECASADIREAIAPFDNSQTAPRRQNPKTKPVQKPKPPTPPSANVNLAKLPAPATDTPQPQRDFDRQHGEIFKTSYVYSLTPEGELNRWVIRTDWVDTNKPKGWDKIFRQWHRDESGQPICKKGDIPWGAYRLDEFIQALKNIPGTPCGLIQEGEKTVEVARQAGIASLTFQGSSWSPEEIARSLIEIKTECPDAVLAFLRDNDTAGESKSAKFQAACDTVGLFSVVIDPVAIHPPLPDKGDIVEILAAMDTPEFIRRLEEEIHAAVASARQQSAANDSIDIPDQFDPNVEFTQKAFSFLYGDKPWICADNKLFFWNGTHYKYSPDTVERPKIANFCNSCPVQQKDGSIRYPYARPSKVREVLQWAKDRLEVDPSLINPPGLNCVNGVLEILWDGVQPNWHLVDHSPNLYYIYEPVVTYDPKANHADCDRLLEVLDQPQRKIFLRTIAASLDLETVRKFKGRLVRGLLLKGDGNNGKDTLREAVAKMYGSQGITGCTLSDFKAYDDGRKFPLSRLKSSRVNWATENATTAALDRLQSVKAFLTGDTLSSEGKGKDELDYTPTAVGLFNVNDTPNLKGTLEAIASRWGVLSFTKTFKIGADPNKGELEADPRFKYDPEFLRNAVLPAFLNRVLQALVDLMRDGIDYSCTQEALANIQRENSHLFQFCHDIGLQYDPGSTLLASEIWELLEQWYQDNGTLSYEETSSGKHKAIWNEQPRKSDPNVKAVNQVIARLSVLFPKAKVVTVPKEGGGKPRMGLQGIGFVPPISPSPSPNFTQSVTQFSPNTSPKESLQDKGFHPSHPISHIGDEKRVESMESITQTRQTALEDGEEVPKLGDLGENLDQTGIVGCSGGCKLGDATSKLGDASTPTNPQQPEAEVEAEEQSAIVPQQPESSENVAAPRVGDTVRVPSGPLGVAEMLYPSGEIGVALDDGRFLLCKSSELSIVNAPPLPQPEVEPAPTSALNHQSPEIISDPPHPGSNPAPAAPTTEPAPDVNAATSLSLEVGDRIICRLSGHVSQIVRLANAGWIDDGGKHISRAELRSGIYTKVAPNPPD